MNIRERAMAVFHREKPDRIPWLIYNLGDHLPRGSWERELRNKGLGLVGSSFPGPVFKAETPNVKVEQRPVVRSSERALASESVVVTTYHTPVGSVSTEQVHGRDLIPWTVPGGYMIKDLRDNEVVKFIVEDTVYTPCYDSFLLAQRHVGDDGYIVGGCGPSPFQNLLKHIMGYRMLAIQLYRHTKEFEALYRVMAKKYEEVLRIVADSPAEIMSTGDNINGRVTSPKLFEKYCMPIYKKAAQLAHKKDKILIVHMDGALRCLKDLIPKTGIDVVEAFTPPPMGDLPLSEARAAWGDRIVIAANFPETVFFSGPEAVRKCTLDILRSVAPGDRFMLLVTESIPFSVMEEGLRTITDVMWEHGKYPIRPETLPTS